MIRIILWRGLFLETVRNKCSFDLSYHKYDFKQEQLDAIDFCYARDSAICALGTGVGKTAVASALARQLLMDYPDALFVFIVPSKAIKAFKKELPLCGIKPAVWESSEKVQSKGSRVLLVTHTSLQKYFDQLKFIVKKYRTFCIVDEIHNFSQTAKITQTLGKLRMGFQKFYGLTATTVRNNITSLYVMSHLTRPGILGRLEQFHYKYCIMKSSQFSYTTKSGYKGTKKVEAPVKFKAGTDLDDVLADLIIYRQLEYDIDFKTLDIPLDAELWVRYRQAGLGKVRPPDPNAKKKSSASDWSVRLIDLQRVVDNCSEFFESIPLSNKEKVLLKLVKNCFDNGNVPIVYCFYLDTIERVKSLLKKYRDQLGLSEVFVISGKIPQKERRLVEDKVRQKTVTIINRAGTESINLQKANTMIYYDIPWSIDEYLQSVGRITRNDTKFDKQFVYCLEYEGTVDNYKVLRIKNHLSLVEQVQGKQIASSNDIALSQNDMKELKKLLLWCFKTNRPLKKEEVLNYIGVNLKE